MALVNPHRSDSRFPFRGMASVGIAFYLAAAVRTRLVGQGYFKARVAPDPRELLDLVALGRRPHPEPGDLLALALEPAQLAAGQARPDARRRVARRAAAAADAAAAAAAAADADAAATAAAGAQQAVGAGPGARAGTVGRSRVAAAGRQRARRRDPAVRRHPGADQQADRAAQEVDLYGRAVPDETAPRRTVRPAA